ncbi:unnamed protein product [Anisakis simplex]|uniref:Secreted protein n=1 Tax=Anisakis simplex TaxID=6269 RepID=A0A0M3KC06_ANISI|nr:unnamed protein product [Anisakis simplex]
MLWFSFASVCILLYSIGVIASSPDNVELDESSDELYILLDEISIYSCRGVKNEIKLSEEDVNIVNENGNRAYFIKAPGNYSLQFKQIKVLDNFGYLSGELSATLQVPILEGPAGELTQSLQLS